MAYTARIWTDGEVDGAIPLDAENLNIMEKGIEEAANMISIGEFELVNDVEIKLGYKPRYLTAISNSGSSSFAIFQNTKDIYCNLKDDGFSILGEVNITNSNISDYFEMANEGDYCFVYDSTNGRFGNF